jgi:hypothetical protein
MTASLFLNVGPVAIWNASADHRLGVVREILTWPDLSDMRSKGTSSLLLHIWAIVEIILFLNWVVGLTVVRSA